MLRLPSTSKAGTARTRPSWGRTFRACPTWGIAGINFEDRVVKGKGVYSTEQQSRRIAAIRKAAEKKGIELFINARTDLFLG